MPRLLVLLSIASGALALAACWGPGTHIQLTLEVLRRLRRKRSPNRAQAIVLRHSQAFLYGNIAADIINFKAFGGVKNHCHNWNIQQRLEELAETEAARAFILGYLCHLAADVVAHNHFVPFHCVHGFPPRIFGHAYWEAMADSDVSDVEWHAIDGLKRSRSIHAFDRLVHRAVRRRALSLRPNKWIFNNILLINCRRRWRKMIGTFQSSPKKHAIDARFHGACRTASLRFMLAVFHPRRLALLKAHDPTGRVALEGAHRLRRELLRDLGHRARAREVARELAKAAYGRM
jgi:hypothetical protein